MYGVVEGREKALEGKGRSEMECVEEGEKERRGEVDRRALV